LCSLSSPPSLPPSVPPWHTHKHRRVHTGIKFLGVVHGRVGLGGQIQQAIHALEASKAVLRIRFGRTRRGSPVLDAAAFHHAGWSGYGEEGTGEGAVKDLGVVAWVPCAKQRQAGVVEGTKAGSCWCGRGGREGGEGPGGRHYECLVEIGDRVCRCIPTQYTRGRWLCVLCVCGLCACVSSRHAGPQEGTDVCGRNATSATGRAFESIVPTKKARPGRIRGTGTRRASTSRGPLPVFS
jgi:hypothetical protein